METYKEAYMEAYKDTYWAQLASTGVSSSAAACGRCRSRGGRTDARPGAVGDKPARPAWRRTR